MLEARKAAFDIAVLALLVILPAAVYIVGIGFYSDDWFFQKVMHFSADQSPTGLFATLYQHATLPPRPIQIFVMEGLFLAFGRDPFWGHVINHTVLFASGALLYLALRRAFPSRPIAFLLAALYLSLPNFSTARLWFANYQATASLLFFALAFYCWVRASQAPGRGVGWQLAAAAAALACSLSYELFLPLLLGAPVVVVLLRLLDSTAATPLRLVVGRMTIATLAAVLVVAMASLYKLAVFSAQGSWTFTEWRELTINLYKAAFRGAFWDLGVKLPLNVAKGLAGPAFRLGAVIAGFAAGVLVYFALLRISADEPQGPGFGLKSFGAAILAGLVGLVAFAAGYIVLLQNFYASLASTGIGNRVNIAASIGVAVVAVSAIALLDLLAGGRLRRVLTFPLVAAFCGLGVLLNAMIGVFWSEAAAEQERVYARIRSALPELPDGAAVLLAGLCPYHGPAPVFTSSWDLSSRLQMDNGQPSLRADVVTADSTLRPLEIERSEYGEPRHYPFGDLWIFDDRTGLATRLADNAAAAAYFAEHPIAEAAPCDFTDGGGVRLF